MTVVASVNLGNQVICYGSHITDCTIVAAPVGYTIINKYNKEKNVKL